MAHDVFISHSSKDREIALRLCASLEDQGLRCWMAPRDIPAGADWSASIVEAIRQSRALVLILSRNANESNQIPREIERAVNAKVPIVPVRVENVAPSGPLEYSLSTIHWFDAFASPIEGRAHELSEEIHKASGSSEIARAKAQELQLAQMEKRRRRRGIELQRSAVAALAVSLVATGLAAMVSRSAPLAAIDNKLLDWRFTLASPRVPSDRIVIVSIDDATVAANQTPLGSREFGDRIGRTIARLFDAGAAAVAVDLLPRSWSESMPFADAVMRHHEKLTLAARDKEDGQIEGPEVLPRVVLAVVEPPAAGRMFGRVNLPVDSDGVIRRFYLNFLDREGVARPAFSTRAVTTLTGTALSTAGMAPALIDYRADRSRLQRVSLKDVPMYLEAREPIFRGRLVLIGAEYEGGGDTHVTPATNGMRDGVPGLVVQALAINTILQNEPLRETTRAWPIVVTALIAFLVGFAAGAWRLWIAIAALAGGLLLIVASAAAVFVWKGSVTAVAGPALAAIVATALCVTLAKQFMRRGAQL